MNFISNQTNNEAVIQSNVEKLNASNSPELKASIIHLNNLGVNKIVIDLSVTKYCDSSGLSAILVANRLCKDSNGTCVLCGLQENVFKLIQIAQLDKVLVIADDLASAVELLN
jgi:anti-anti-sigma factor